ncbi:MAG: anion permease [Desulfovibrionaceae bacterium]|nr:anion permease [Desulfovibrionaceae bacterium]
MNERANPSVMKQIFRIFLGPVVFLLFLSLPAPEGLSPLGMKCCGAGLWVVLWWITEPFPIALTSLFSLLLYAALGLLKPPVSFAFLGNPSIVLLLGSMILLGVWKESRLIERYAYWTISMGWVKGRPLRLLLVFGLAGGTLSMIIPNIPVAILFVSIAVAMAKGVGAKQGEPLYRCLCMSSGISSALGGAGTPIGGAPNLVVIGVIASALHYEMPFWAWSAIGFPMAMLWLLVMVALLWLMLLRGVKDTEIPLDIAAERLKALGPVTKHEHIAMATMGLALFLWSFGQPLAKAMGFPGLARILTPPIIALFCGCLLFFIPMEREKDGIRFAMSWQQGLRAMNWDILIFVAGALAFGDMLIQGGVDKFMAGHLSNILGDMSPTMVWVVLMALSGLVSQAFSNVAVIGFMLPITAAISVEYGLNPIVTCLTVGMVSNIGIMFPVSSPPTAVTLMGAEGYTTAGDFLRFSVPMIASAAIIALLMGTLLGDIVFPAELLSAQ